MAPNRFLTAAELADIGVAFARDRSAHDIALELGRSHTSISRARSRPEVVAAEKAERRRIAHRDEERLRRDRIRARRAELNAAAPPAPAPKLGPVRPAHSPSASDGRLLGIFTTNGPKTAAEGQPAIVSHYKRGRKPDYDAWLDGHDARNDPARLAAEERAHLDADEEQHLRIDGPYSPRGMWRAPDGVLRPLENVLTAAPELADAVEAALDRLEERVDERNAGAVRQIAEQRALVQAARGKDVL